ncbi:hypothetical protein H5410_047630 [Solanum commersonii]|uniref:Uncharacterized protein n=1 Tax=Solanum commersonii TaxID=4109 RepID=A0A9J5XIU8_SOLCO|nr:hypothetical protein H5410_047630 [Solanum commersonii]
MASSSQKGKDFMRPTKSVGVDFDDKPLWNHVKVISIAPNGVTGSYYRVKAHLLRLSGHGVQICKESSGDIYATLKMEHEQAERKRTVVQVDERIKVDYISLPEGTDLIQQKKKSSSGGAIGKSFGIHERNTANKLAARMFYASVKTREIKSLIMNDEKWDSIDYFLKFIKPIVDMLRSADIDGPKLHLIYDM